MGGRRSNQAAAAKSSATAHSQSRFPDELTVLVTGAGFVGGEIVDALVEAHPSWKIVVVDIKPPEAYTSRHRHVSYFQADLTKLHEACNAVEWVEPRVIVHTAGIVPQGIARYNGQDRDAVFHTNVMGTKCMLDAAEEGNVPIFVYTSSCCAITDDLDHEYPNFTDDTPIPSSGLIYGQSKAAAERLVLAANSATMMTCALRPSVILGREDYQLVPTIHACIDKWETPFAIGSEDNLYDFTYCPNVAWGHVLAVENLLTTKTAAGEAISITNNQPVTFRDFCLAVWAGFGHAPPFKLRIPYSLAWVAGTLAEARSTVTGSRATLCRGSVKDATGTRYASQVKAQEILGYWPKVDLDEGIRISCQHYQDRINREKASAKKRKP